MDIDWLRTVGIALCIGVPLGMIVMAYIVGATRCENCCQNSDKL